MNGEFTRYGGRAQNSVPTTPKIKDKDRFSQAFNVMVNYWEMKPAQYEAKLHELALKDVRVVSCFVPWAHVETDIYHSLKKFARAAFAARLGIRIFVMPELGVNYPNAGIPKDLLAQHANLAVDHVGRVIYNVAAPNIFPLPSFSSPEVLKRFGNYLIKVSSILSEVFSEVGTSEFCEIVVSNAFFNYYRNQGLTLSQHGDYSAAHVMAFRDFLDREYRLPVSQSEPEKFVDPETFKMQLYESYNRHRFFTHVEKLLREKTEMMFSRKGSTCDVHCIDLYNPECDPEASYQGLLAELYDFKPSVERCFDSIVSGGNRGEVIWLGSAGAFRRFSDQEKSFLMLASLVHSGEVGLPADEIFKLSTGFHRKLRALMLSIEEGRFSRQNKVTYVSASKFSMEERSYGAFSKMVPGFLRVLPGLENHSKEISERLVFMDPKSVIRSFEFLQLLSAAQTGKVVAIPAPMSKVANYTGDALAHLEKFKKGKHGLRMNIGLAYEVYEYHLGHVIFYDPQLFWSGNHNEALELPRFFQALLGLADVKSVCSVSDARARVVTYVCEDDQSQQLLFLLNPTRETLRLTLSFEQEMILSGAGSNPSDGENPLTGKSFELQIPPLGVLPMQLRQAPASEAQWN